jgi:NADPH:quinone reductase-like Zn-dependent oxidoreductase
VALDKKDRPMKAALVTEFGIVPRYAEVAAPVPPSSSEELIDVVAAGLHPRVRSQASGSHYTSTDELPLVPGIDGVGRRADGSLVYFILPDTTNGSMAEQTVIDVRRSVPLPADIDPVLLAAAMNPAMSSWIALTQRITFEPGQSVLILGATGSAGQLAAQVAKHLGAGRVIAAGRGASKLAALAALGADDTVDLSADPSVVASDLSAKAGEVDVVLDYLWGAPAEAAIMPILLGREDRGRLLSWIQIGSVAGPDIALPSAVLRQANIHFLGSGQGSASTRAILEVLPALAEQISAGAFVVDAAAHPLSDVSELWAAEPRGTTARVVLVP